MTEHPDPHPQHELEQCNWALARAHAFLRGEVDDSEAEAIREHLNACESCLDDYEVQEKLTSLIRRCYPQVSASSVLRARVSAMRITFTRYQP